MTKKEMEEDGVEGYREVLERSEDYFNSLHEAGGFWGEN